jgi:hypothetical protein
MKPIINIIVDVETIGIFRPGFHPCKSSAQTVSKSVDGHKLSKAEEKELNKKMIISNAVFNVGFTVQRNGEVLEKAQIGIDEFWLYPEHRIMDFYRKNFAKDGSDFTERYETFGEFLVKRFYPMIHKYKEHYRVKFYSYNADFDRRAFIDTAKLEGMRIPESITDKWKCILIKVANTLLVDGGRKYFNWIIEQEYKLLSGYKYDQQQYLSAGRNARIKAETVYRYISNDISFIEAHKGMQDTEIEGKILEWCKNHKGAKLEEEPTSGGWAVLNADALPFKKKGNFDSRDIVALLSPANQEKLYEILEKRGDEFVRYEG